MVEVSSAVAQDLSLLHFDLLPFLPGFERFVHGVRLPLKIPALWAESSRYCSNQGNSFVPRRLSESRAPAVGP